MFLLSWGEDVVPLSFFHPFFMYSCFCLSLLDALRSLHHSNWGGGETISLFILVLFFCLYILKKNPYKKTKKNSKKILKNSSIFVKSCVLYWVFSSLDDDSNTWKLFGKGLIYQWFGITVCISYFLPYVVMNACVGRAKGYYILRNHIYVSISMLVWYWVTLFHVFN